jgi:hypothetical protein
VTARPPCGLMGDNGLQEVGRRTARSTAIVAPALVPTTTAGPACKYSKMAAASAVCLETKRTGSPPVLA